MARYTMEIRELISTFGNNEVESWFKDYNLEDYLTAEEIAVIESRGVWTKDQLAKRIIGHFFLREIGCDSVGRFKLFAKDLMAEIMETYAPLIYSASIKYDPLVNVDYSEVFNRASSNENNSNSQLNANENSTINRSTEGSATSSDTTSGSTSGSSTTQTESTSNGSGLEIHSDTPQGQVSKANILAGNYASSTDANEKTEHNVSGTTTSDSSQTSGTGSSTSSNTGTEHTNSFGSNSSNGSSSSVDHGTENYIKTVKGNSGVSATAQKMVLQYRENIRALNTEIVYRLEPLFMGLY